MEPKIIFQDREILVLDKPAGMIVNRSDTTVGEKTVQEWVEGRIKEVSKEGKVSKVSKGEVEPFDTFLQRAGIVHRLDKETSGILLTAKTKEAFENLQKQFKERKVKKTYIALVHGKIESVEGEINVPVGRLPWNRKRFGVLTGGRDAITKYKLLSVLSCQLSDTGQSVNQSISWGNRLTEKPKNKNQKTENRKQITEHFSLLELYPETGRTHQIRVHLKYFGHPIFADPLYGGRKTARNDRKLLSRIFLHAAKISFYHPKTNRLVSFESHLPEELIEFLAHLSS